MIPKKPAPPKRVLIGEITSVHGIRGEVVVRSYTSDPGAIGAYGALEGTDGRNLPALQVVRVTDRGVIARLDGIADRTAAEKYKRTELWIARDRLPAADNGEYYHADLVGLIAVSPDGSAFGSIIAVENFGAGDLLEIQLTATRQTEYIPFTNAYVPHIDIAAGHAIVVMPQITADEPDEHGDDDQSEPV